MTTSVNAMLLQGTVFARDPFASVMAMQVTTWKQRMANGETALAFGLAKPAIPGEYGPLDVIMTGIVNLCTFHHRVEMKLVAEKVREKWPELTRGIAISERDLWEAPGVLRVPAVPRIEQQFFALSSTADKKTAWAGVGKMQSAIGQVDGVDRAIFMLDLQRVISMAYKMAGEAKPKVKFPERLCPEPDTPAWDDWMNAIDDYRDAAGIRAKALARKKSKSKVTA